MSTPSPLCEAKSELDGVAVRFYLVRHAIHPLAEHVLVGRMRIVGHLAYLQQQENEEACIILVTHAEVIRTAVLYCLGRSLDEFHTVRIDAASVTTLQADMTRVRVLAANERWTRETHYEQPVH